MSRQIRPVLRKNTLMRHGVPLLKLCVICVICGFILVGFLFSIGRLQSSTRQPASERKKPLSGDDAGFTG